MHSQFLWPSFTKPTVFCTPVEPILMVCISLFMFVGSFTEICNVSGYEVDLFWPWTRESKEWFYRGYFWGWGNANESTDLRSPDVGISGSVSSISVLNVHSCPIRELSQVVCHQSRPVYWKSGREMPNGSKTRSSEVNITYLLPHINLHGSCRMVTGCMTQICLSLSPPNNQKVGSTISLDGWSPPFSL